MSNKEPEIKRETFRWSPVDDFLIGVATQGETTLQVDTKFSIWICETREAETNPEFPFAPLQWKRTIENIAGNAELTYWDPEEGDLFELTGEPFIDSKRDGPTVRLYGCRVTNVGRGGMFFTCERCEVHHKDGPLLSYHSGPIDRG